LKKTDYELTETIWDLKNEPFSFYYRKDTVSEPDFKLIENEFIKDTYDDVQLTYEHLLMKYEQSWFKNDDMD